VTSELRIPKQFADEIVEHCRAGIPNEACGILASRDGQMVKVFRMRNAEASPVRYSLDSREQFDAYKTIEEKEWDLAAVFHSHTRTEAYPSPTDVRLAVEPVPYLIVSLAREPPVLRAFLIEKKDLRDERGDVEEVPVIVDG
jgi:proteasome lid subunit RPN8/RPN11